MNLLKKIGIAAAVIIAIPLIAAIFVKKEYTVLREITINRSKTDVFSYIKLLKNQENYSRWAQMDPKMKKTYQGTDGTAGFISGWESTNKDVGKGEQEIKKITEGERIDYELRFIEPFQGTEQAFMAVETVSDEQTKVKWGFNGHMAYPMNLMMLFMNFEEMIGKDFDIGLNGLKQILEKKSDEK
ncbi:MAG TPA: SRPBCC family protein [Leptospiraceae bacterium]|nr:SRPBCC family protein [Leptospiraceae bacterium]HMY69837.1 SRPBCC family protein [Leptospiraceae bacterium]HMZ57143.1 SRPBCC family protein [Leptospiraceae bacterium]HNF15754.1 SRPBCC family protein [Leptospiraceae bacterium]HNF24002.1 SRPBCC family protein [Leptospiraceae bacterium]